ncbi:hypothetical protein ACFPRL_30725 [Pseudoclavibacter helvolus]
MASKAEAPPARTTSATGHPPRSPGSVSPRSSFLRSSALLSSSVPRWRSRSPFTTTT